MPQDTHESGSGVFRIEINAPASQGFKAHLSAGESESSVNDKGRSIFDQLGKDLGQKPALHEILGTDHDPSLRG